MRGWNPNLERATASELCLVQLASALGGMESWTGRRSRRATLLGVHARVESARGTLCVYVYLVNPRRACAARVTEKKLVCLSVCYHVFCRYAQRDGQKAIPTGSVPHWLYFENGDFDKNATFESYGVKQSEGANMQISTGVPRPVLRTLEVPEIVTQGEYRLPRAI